MNGCEISWCCKWSSIRRHPNEPLQRIFCYFIRWYEEESLEIGYILLNKLFKEWLKSKTLLDKVAPLMSYSEQIVSKMILNWYFASKIDTEFCKKNQFLMAFSHTILIILKHPLRKVIWVKICTCHIWNSTTLCTIPSEFSSSESEDGISYFVQLLVTVLFPNSEVVLLASALHNMRIYENLSEDTFSIFVDTGLIFCFTRLLIELNSCWLSCCKSKNLPKMFSEQIWQIRKVKNPLQNRFLDFWSQTKSHKNAPCWTCIRCTSRIWNSFWGWWWLFFVC